MLFHNMPLDNPNDFIKGYIMIEICNMVKCLFFPDS